MQCGSWLLTLRVLKMVQLSAISVMQRSKCEWRRGFEIPLQRNRTRSGMNHLLFSGLALRDGRQGCRGSSRRSTLWPIADAPDLLVRSGQSLGYRNKITYNVPIVEWSDLAEERLNDICRSVQCWQQQQQQQHESTTSLASSVTTTICEVMVKVSRQNEFMVRVTVEAPPADDVRDHTMIQHIAGSAATAAPPWSTAFRDFLLTRHPQIVCLCYNVMSITGAKPMKDYDSYRFLTEQRFLVETKPTMMMTSTMEIVDVVDTDGDNNGGRRNVEQYCHLQISPDTFSEVNTMVEDLQFRQKKIWLADEPVADVLLVSGRDICSFGLSYRRRIDQHVVAVQHDPLVHRDALVNLQPDCGHSTVLLAAKATMVDCLERCPELAKARSVHCVTTGGRHGMNPAYLQYLVAHEAIEVILYNSCNTKSLVRDMRGFLNGGFYVADFRSYDLFPGTRFTASVTKLKRRPRTLLLPIGPAGVG
jgi:hypothetical protein